MAITKPWTVPEEPLTAEPVPLVDLSKPIPSWNTPEYPAEWPRNDEMSVAPRHVVILHYLYSALSTLLRRRGRPFAVNQEIGLHFIDARGQAQRCDPDLIIMPFPNTGRGSLRRQDMPCPPDCVIEVASQSTADNDLGIKKTWYAWMGVREYWILDPVDSNDPTHFERGVLLPDGPLMGWRLEQSRYEPLETFWDAAARTWTAYSSVLDCDILLSQELHREETDGGYRILDPETGEPLASSNEKDELLAEKDQLLAEQDVHLEQQRQRLEDQGTEVAAFITDLARFRYGDAVVEQLEELMQQSSAPMPARQMVQAWMAAPSTEEFLDAAGRYFGVSPTGP
ncbi:MAG: Uma2 family endonuclease [Caldilineaceae bacterium SB0664_bin_22]|nr:Uma2 family endonuclease [Caldilineaceae bacterium SB0664_bin_22]